MTERPVGYYVHHHGAGHLMRARVIRNAMPRPVILMGSSLGPQEGIALDDDRRAERFDGIDACTDRADALHYAPIDHHGIRNRVAAITGWIARERPALMIVDVSVEVAMLARLASVATVYVRLNGERHDPAHLEAFRGARALIAPFAWQLEAPGTPAWIRKKTHYAPGLTAMKPAAAPAVPRVLVIMGEGGGDVSAANIAAAATACPDHEWKVIGRIDAPADCPANLDFAGWTDSVADEIAKASVIVGAAGDGVVGAALAADRPFVCIPQHRPYAEQLATAAGLAREGAAIVRSGWPRPADWPGIIAAASALDPARRRALHDPDAAFAVATWLETLAAESVDEGCLS